jgi:hypothetical protein
MRFAPLLLLAACAPSTSIPAPGRTSPDITAADARSRIFLVADDSMQGRRAGTIGNYKMTSYIEREVSRLGLEPGGERGTFYQVVPIVRRETDSMATSMTVNGQSLRLFEDFAPLRPNTTERYGASLAPGVYATVYGGRAGDSTASLPDAQVTGRIVVLDAPLDATGQPTGVWGTAGAISVARFPTAAGIAIGSLDLATTAAKNGLRARTNAIAERDGAAPRPMTFVLTSAAARSIMAGSSLSTLQRGARGVDVIARARFIDMPVDTPARNVIAILRGSDASLRSEYVAIGAHSDHVGIAARPVDHDSLRAYNTVMRPQGAQARGTMPGPPTPAQWSRIGSIRDSILRLRPPRLDSISNGADDDGSGSVALLEIAESMAAGPRPKRSMIFVWHTAEESGLLGSAHFTENPTVPRSQIVAQFNMDMVGRGTAGDIPGGGPRYLQVVGSRRLSTDLGDVIDSVNAARKEPMLIDYSFDAPGHVMARYCRSDHYNYARRGIPIAYVSRGYHQDYHVVTDEPQYINYPGLARTAAFVRDIATAVANRSDRVRVDKVVPNMFLPCRQ